MSAEATCAVCGRTILAGERVHGYLEGAHEQAVCELCVARAEQLGWHAAGEGEPLRTAGAREGGGRLRGLLRRGQRRPGGPSVPPLTDAAAAPPESAEPGRSTPQRPDAAPERADPAAAPQRPRRIAPPDAAVATPAQRALVRFNASEAGRTVTGLARTLGRPWVSVGALAGEPDEVRITVAWELSWYQWGVDIGDELRPVFQIDKGQEIDQLDSAARQWNASVGADGKVSLGAAGRPVAGKPAAG